MLKAKSVKVALATLTILLLMILPNHGGSSQDNATRKLDVTQYSFDGNCKVKCHKNADGCRNPPPRKALCVALANEHWCCQEWKYKKSDIATAPQHTCPKVADTTCKTFDGHPRECRLACNCAYNCAAGKCENSMEIKDKPCFDGCWNHCQDRCGCKERFGCIYEPGTGICKTQLERYCRLSHFPGHECGRKGAFYVIGDSICENKVELGYCDLDMVLVSANLGSDTAAVDSQRIEYKPEKDLKKNDPFGISQSISFAADDIKSDHIKDKDIYISAVVGNAKTCSNESRQCVDYTIPIMNWEGDYELALRMHEGVYDKKGKRRFSAYFANVELFSELDIMSFTNEKFRPLDLIVNFKVSDQGKTITIKGHRPKHLGSNTKLSLCRGECGEDNSFLVSAFHIIKQKEFKNPDACDTSKPLEECDDFHPDACRRADAIYSFRDKLCKSTKQAGNCYIADQILAINFNGEATVDSRGIEYQSEDGKFKAWENENIMLSRETEGVIAVDQEEDKNLYAGVIYGVIYGDPNGPKKACMWYLAKFCQDGRYEIAFRLVDDESDAIGKRKFKILISEHSTKYHRFIDEIDIFYLSGGQKGKPVDIHLNFEIIKNVVRWGGPRYDYEWPLNSEKGFWVGFCSHSLCTNTERTHFMVAAMSIVAFGKDPELANSTCTAHHGDPCGCRYDTFCEYDVVNEKCHGRKAVCAPQCGWKTDRECRRAGEHIYYAHAGKVCKNTVDTMNQCKLEDTLLAVNMGDNPERHTDIYGIYYQKDSEVNFDDPDDTRKGYSSRDNVKEGVPSADIPLYNLHAWGKSQGHEGRPRCLTFHIPVKVDGLHQLSLKTGEPWRQYLKTRDFSIKFNGQYIVQEYEPAQYRIIPNAFDLNTNFYVYGAGTKMLMNGHPPSQLDDRRIPISLCFGSCTWEKVDINWALGAFSVIRFNQTIPCFLLKGDACGCQAQDGCEFNVVTKECVSTGRACKQVRGSLGDCRRAGEHVYYADAGIICPSTKARGQCGVAETIVADNYDKPEATDSNGISFNAGNSLLIEDPDNTMRAGGFDESVEGIPSDDYPLYTRYIMGDKSIAKNSCATFYVPTSGDGSYELRIRPFQKDYKENRKQEFDILFNGRTVVEALDIHSVRPFPKPFELNVHFKVTHGGTKMQMSGHPPTDITTADKTIPLAYCYGKCTWPDLDPAYSIAAMSVVKFKLCSDFNGDACACRNATGCEYNTLTQTCGVGVIDCSKISYGNDDTCWRGGSNVFYSHGGVVCNKMQGSGNCQLNATTSADYFNGPRRTDSNGVQSRSGVTASRKCTKILVSIDGDGEYELSVKSGEVHYDPPNTRKKRSYNYKFNKQLFLQGFDAAAYRPYPAIVDVNIQFTVSGGGTKLKMRGFPEKDIVKTPDEEDTVWLYICSAKCDEYDEYSQLSAVTVVKFQTVQKE